MSPEISQPTDRPRLLVTGPAGRVGPHLLPFLRDRYALRLLDLNPLPFERSNDDEFVQADIRNLPAIEQACARIHAVIHLAAIPDEADFHSLLLPINLAGVYNAFEAARRAGVPKVIFISTGQTVLSYPKGAWVSPDMPARPSSVYACTKLFGEALARHYSDLHGLQMIVIRLCWFQPYDSPLLRAAHPIWREWCSPRDFGQLVLKALEADLPFGVFFGVSNNTGRFWDIQNAAELLGYHPVDDAYRR
jgi:nucleoside-diphosphate-sugar epimerase